MEEAEKHLADLRVYDRPHDGARNAEEGLDLQKSLEHRCLVLNLREQILLHRPLGHLQQLAEEMREGETLVDRVVAYLMQVVVRHHVADLVEGVLAQIHYFLQPFMSWLLHQTSNLGQKRLVGPIQVNAICSLQHKSLRSDSLSRLAQFGRVLNQMA